MHVLPTTRYVDYCTALQRMELPQVDGSRVPCPWARIGDRGAEGRFPPLRLVYSYDEQPSFLSPYTQDM